MKRHPSKKDRAKLSDVSDADYTSAQIDPLRGRRRKKIEYLDSPTEDGRSSAEWEDARLEFAGRHPRR